MRVRIIQPVQNTARKRRTCAYARVSTDSEKQNDSLENQVIYYENLIRSNPGYEYLGVFADQGITGTTDNRPEFQRMLELCRDGKIDLIITKSISRLARNTTVLLQTVRELKDLGIEVIFEKENICTLTGDGELMLTVLASFAEEESRNISENVKWSTRKGYQKGLMYINTNKFLGYDKDKDGNLIINEREARVIRRIYDLYVSGTGCAAIVRILKAEGIKTYSGKEKWDNSSLINILKNEKYQGDVLCQKTYVKDYLSKKSVRNRGELNQYYIRDNHPAIVSREVWKKVQERMAENKYRMGMANDSRYNHKYPYKGLLFCSKCGGMLRRRCWSNRYATWYVWQCSNFLNRRNRTCNGTTVREQELANVCIQGETIVKEVIEDGKKHYHYSRKIGPIEPCGEN